MGGRVCVGGCVKEGVCGRRCGHPSEPGSSLGLFLDSRLSREFFLAVVLLRVELLVLWGLKLGI